ncbi:hypothetical protein [uncultured Roseobacter sp.]|uniref:hypothetical protein n=1 Tax=uncultured Roseobacter sp. TaxID=114847 RepID=UPI002621B9BC|nr:hypothetical protein [uncultured Roseobacter sp.]
MCYMRCALSGAILTGVATAAASFELATLAPCYTRSYTAAHLKAHPSQNVATLSLALRAEEGFAIAQLTGRDRDGRPGHLSFMCWESAPGAYADGCNTLEGDSQMWITVETDGGIAMRTRNVFLSDIGQGIDYLDDVEGHYRFYLEEAEHSFEPGTGPFFTFRLAPAEAEACADPG